MTRYLLIAAALLALVIAGLWFAWLAPALRAGREQQDAARGIRGFQNLKSKWNGAVWAVHYKGIGDAEIRQLVKLDLPDLILLQVTGSQLSDDSFAALGKLSQLQELNLWGTKVTAAGLKHLAALTHLRKLNLTDCGVTFEDVKRLQKSLPDTRIVI